MNPESTSVLAVLATPHHLLMGKVALGSMRLLEVLNDSRTDYLSLANTRIVRAGSTDPIATVSQAVVRKSNIALAMLVGNKHEAPQKRCDRFLSKARHGVFLIVQGYEVRGELALKMTGDPVTALCQELESFFPVPEGTVTFADGTVHQAQVLIINKDHVSLFQLDNAPPNESMPDSRKAQLSIN